MAISQRLFGIDKDIKDYQRKIEYNKDKNLYDGRKLEGRAFNDFGPVSIDDVKSLLWNRIKYIEFEKT